MTYCCDTLPGLCANHRVMQKTIEDVKHQQVRLAFPHLGQREVGDLDDDRGVPRVDVVGLGLIGHDRQLAEERARAEIEHVIADSGATLVVRDVAQVDRASGFGPSAEADPREVAALFYTSGTTGSPKGAQLTHRGLLGGMSLGSLLPTALHRDEVLIGLPVAHIYGFTAVVGAACAGIPTYFQPRFHPVQALDAIEERRCTVFAGVPAMYKMLLEAGASSRDLTCVRLWVSGADAMPPELAATFKSFGATVTLPLIGPLGEASFAEGYGMVESGGGVAVRMSPPLIPTRLGGSVGMPLPGIPEGLSKGVIDGAIVPYEIAPSIKLDELTKFVAETDRSQPAMCATVFETDRIVSFTSSAYGTVS
mgnify:CR=1 FL=1